MANDTQYKDNLTLDEIVFENRNKEYGAYDLRTSYPKLLTKSFIIGTILFLVMALSPLIYVTIQKLTAPPKEEVNANLLEILDQPEEEILEQPEEETPPPPPPPKEEPVQQEVIQNVVPEPVKAPKVETPPPTITKQLDTTTGLVNQEGVKTPTYAPPPPPPSTGNKGNTVEVKPAVSKTEVYTTVDQAADFGSGGINGFRNKFQEEFDQGDIEAEGTLKTEITFVVEINGNITDVKATGPNREFNRQAELAIKAIKGKWTPGKLNGEPVRSRFRFPVTMNFEN